jgi:hypothetical protein
VSGPEYGVLEVNVNYDLKVAASAGSTFGLATAEPTCSERALPAEEGVEDVTKSGRIAATALRRIAEAVIVRTAVRVAERFVRRGDLFEPGLSLGVVGITVGVKLARQLAIRAFDLVWGGGAINTEEFVQVSHGFIRV